MSIFDKEPCLAIVAGPISKRFYPLRVDVSIGRAPESDVCIYSDEVALRQARIVHDAAGELVIEDLGGSGATLVNGQPVLRQRLRYGDCIQIGSAIMVFISSRLIDDQQPDPFASFGEVGGMGHRFNNLMAVVLSNVSYVRNVTQRGVDERENVLDALEEIESSAAQVIDMTSELLGVSEAMRGEESRTDASSLVREVAEFVAKKIGDEVTVQVETEPELVIEGDRDALASMLTNICFDACSRMPGGGSLTIRAAEEQGHELGMDGPTASSDEPCVVVSVRDTGERIDEAACSKVVTPLYSTGLDGGGSGDGSTIIYGVIRAHNGHVTIESTPDQGTTFKIYFPTLQQSAAVFEPWKERDVEPQEARTVLLIDDEAPVLRSTRRLLEQRGYEVICANNGQVGLEIFRDRGDSIDLVMLDLLMPIMDGAEAYGLLKNARSELPVIIASGCSECELDDQAVFDRWGKPVFLSKPYSQHDLYEALDRVRG